MERSRIRGRRETQGIDREAQVRHIWRQPKESGKDEDKSLQRQANPDSQEVGEIRGDGEDTYGSNDESSLRGGGRIKLFHYRDSIIVIRVQKQCSE